VGVVDALEVEVQGLHLAGREDGGLGVEEQICLGQGADCGGVAHGKRRYRGIEEFHAGLAVCLSGCLEAAFGLSEGGHTKSQNRKRFSTCAKEETIHPWLPPVMYKLYARSACTIL
jgi:hypothetical protein